MGRGPNSGRAIENTLDGRTLVSGSASQIDVAATREYNRAALRRIGATEVSIKITFRCSARAPQPHPHPLRIMQSRP